MDSFSLGIKAEAPTDVTKVDMDKLADGLQKLNEDDLLQVVQMVHDNKSADSYTKNDVDRKCFHLSSCGFGLYSTYTSCTILPLDRNAPTHIILHSGRVPRRPLHPPRQPAQDALGLHGRARRTLSTRQDLS